MEKFKSSLRIEDHSRVHELPFPSTQTGFHKTIRSVALSGHKGSQTDVAGRMGKEVAESQFRFHS